MITGAAKCDREDLFITGGGHDGSDGSAECDDDGERGVLGDGGVDVSRVGGASSVGAGDCLVGGRGEIGSRGGLYCRAVVVFDGDKRTGRG